MELSQVFQALRNADAAGDTEAAKRLAQIAKGIIAEGGELDEADTKKEKTKEAPTIGGQFKEFAKGIIPGAIGMVESAGTGISALLPDQQELIARNKIRSLAAAAREPFAAAPGYEETVGRKLGESVGSVGPFLALGPLGAAGRLGMAGLGVGAGAGEARVRAEQEGATADQRSLATALGSVVGATEMFAPARILGRLSAPVQAGAAAAVRRALMAGGEEAAQEAAAQIAQNLIAKGIYKPDQAVIEQVGESAAYGGATGALVQGLLDLAIGRRAKPVTPPGPVAGQQPAAQPGEQPPEVVPGTEAIPEPTLRQPPTPAQPEPKITAKAAKAEEARARRLEKEQQEYLQRYALLQAQRDKDTAEYERIKALTPEEYALEQAQEVPGKTKVPRGMMPEPTGIQPIAAFSDAQKFAAAQVKLAQDREPYVDTSSYVDYILAKPEMARALVAAGAAIPGLSPAQSQRVLSALESTLTLQDKAAAKEAKAAAGQATLAAQQRLGTVEGEEQAALEAQRAEADRLAREAEQADQDARRAQRIQPEVEGIRRLGRVPEDSFSEANRIAAQERLAQRDHDAAVVEELVGTLPRQTGKIMPGTLYRGLGGKKASIDDLRTQLKIALATKDRETAQNLIRELRSKEDIGTDLTADAGRATAELQDLLGTKPADTSAQEKKAESYADDQRLLMVELARVKALAGRIGLPETQRQRVSAIKEQFAEAHANEINARRAMFGLPEMADWERGEARARAMEALNTLDNNWGQFNNPVTSVRQLQRIVRKSTFDDVLNAAQRFNLQAQDTAAKKMEPRRGQQFFFEDEEGRRIEGKTMETPRDTGPRIAAPAELSLREAPRRAAEDKQDALDLIEQALSTAERRTRAVPTIGEKPPAKVGSLAEMARLFEQEKTGGNAAKMDQASIDLLERLREALPGSTDPEFAKLAREQAQQVLEGNLPNPFAVRDLDEMMRAQEAAGRSAASALSAEETGRVARGEAKFEAQPQRELFSDMPQTVRDTVRNFQKLLDSGQVQKLREDIEKRRQNNIDALQRLSREIPTATNKLRKAKAHYTSKLKTAQKSGTVLHNFKQEFAEDLGAISQTLMALQAARDSAAIAVQDIEAIRTFLLSEPTDMALLINAGNALKQEPALRKKLKQAEEALAVGKELEATINATIAADDTLVKPLQKRMAAANKDLFSAQEDLAEANRALQAEKQQAAAAEAAEKARAAQTEAEAAITDQTKATPEPVWRGALQAGREGLNLPGVRLEKDTSNLKEQIAEIRSAMGSLDEQIDNETDADRKAELQAKLDEQKQKLDTVYANAPVVKTELLTRKAEKEAREFDEAQAAAYDAASARRRKRRGEKAPKLQPVARVGAYRDTRTNQIVQPFKPTPLVEPAVVTTNKLIKARSDLAELQRRMTFLKTNKKHLEKGKISPTYRKLEEDEKKLKNSIKDLQAKQKKIVGVERAAVVDTRRAGEMEQTQLSQAVERESERFARGVEVASPDLTADQVQALENNKLTSVLFDIAEDPNADKLNRAVAKRLATMLSGTDVLVQDRLYDNAGGEVLGSAISTKIELSRNGGLSQEVLLHEGTHAVTERVIKLFKTDPSKLTETQRVAVKELMAIHKAIQNDPRITSTSAKGSLSEFVAEVFSNKKLQEQLRAKPWRLADMLRAIKSIVLRLVGFTNAETETMLGASITAIDALMVPSSAKNLGRETKRSRKMSAKDIAALHTGSNSMKQFSEQFGDRIKQKDRTPEDVERIAGEVMADLGKDLDRTLSVPTADTLDYKAMATMSDGKLYDNDNPLHFVEAEPATHAAVEAMKNPRLREQEAEAIADKRKKDFSSLAQYFSDNYNNFTAAEMALVLKAASKYAVLSGKNGQLRLAELASNNRHDVAVVGKDGADAVIEQLRRGKGLKQAFLDGLQEAANKNARANERLNGWKKFDQAAAGETKNLSKLYTQAEISAAFNKTGYDSATFGDDNELVEQLIQDGLLEDRRTNATNLEEAAIALNAGCAGTSWCTGAHVSTARGQIEGGDFYVYYKNGRPEVAVRMNGTDSIGEIRGNTPDQSLTKEQQQIAETFLRSKDFKNSNKYLDERKRREVLTKLFSDPDFNDYKALTALGDFVRNGKVSGYRVVNMLDFAAFGGYSRARASDAVREALEKRLNKVVHAAYASNNFIGEALRFSGDKQKVELEFDEKKYVADISTIESAFKIDFDPGYDGPTLVAPKLRDVSKLEVHAGKTEAPGLTRVKEMVLYGSAYQNTEFTASPDAVINTVEPYSRRGTFVINGVNTIGELAEPKNSATVLLPDVKYVNVTPLQGPELFDASQNALVEYLRTSIRDADNSVGFSVVREPFTGLSMEAKKAFKQAMRNIAAVFDMRNYNVQSENWFDEDMSPRQLFEKFFDEYAGDYVRADMLAFNKKANEKLGLGGTDSLIATTGTVETPSKIANTPVATALTQTDEQPVYARAQATGMDQALDTASQLIASKKTVRERINANLGLSFRTQALDRLAPLEKIALEMMDPLKGLQMMTYLRFADQKMSFVQGSVGIGAPQLVKYERADGRDEYLVENVPGANLSSVVMKLRDTPGMNAEAANQLFTLYLAAKRGDRVGYDKLNFKMPEAQIKAAVKQIESNDGVRTVFEEARTLYNSYNRDLMKFLESTGALSPQEAKRLSDTNDYIPFYREENGYAVLVVGGEGTFRIGNLKDQPQLRELIGGEQKILDFMTSSVQNTSMIVDIGLRNLATKNAMFELQDLGLARFLGSDTSGPDIVTFKDKGVTKYVRVETDSTGIPPQLLVKGMEGIPVNNSALVRALGYAASGVRKGVMLNPLYPVKQLFRDSVAAPMVSGADFVPVLGALKQIGASATKQKLEARGVVGGQVFTGTNEDLSRILKDLQAGKIGLGQVVAKAEAIAMEADALTRRAQYDSYIKQGFSEMEATLMSLESMNFNRKGLSPSARFLATTIPFFNAQLQSLDALYRSLRGKMPMSKRLDIQGKLIRRGALLASTAVAYALLMQDDEAYKNATPEQKYNNIFVRIPGVAEPLRFPVPFEVGYLFKSLPEAIVNLMAGGPKAERDALAALRGIALQTVPGGTSLLMPAALKPIVENVANYSFFMQGQLEGKREQSLLPEYRYRDTTSELAKGLGMATGTSPIKIENLVRGYLGPAGMALMQAFDFAMPKAGGVEQATKRLSETPVIGTLFQPNDAKGIINDVFDRVTEINQIKSTYRDLLAEGKGAEARAFLQQNVNEYAQAAVAGNFRTQMETLTKAETAVKASAYGPEKKREMLDRLRELKIRMATNTSDVFDRTTPR